MKHIRTGIYVGYKDKDYYLSNYGYIGDEKDRDKPDGFYICLDDKEEDCYEELSGTEYVYYSKPAKSNEIEYLYEINHYVICNGRKYKSFIDFPEKGEIWVYVVCYSLRNTVEFDSKYKVAREDRDGVFLAVPFDEVTLYETKTYYDKDKFINEDIREVLSEETYLIDEPWWLEESDNK
ncbi:hypothetical protein SAMN02745111_00348 [Eubacterium uniforme]|uniref:Uncharacterized protein n=1 Tax=Eubacterium uniforme TaxID=39495 RepID=A0A1T4V7S4_9FIRM|nr:hypothetical protein [Eubacterium uniforme]SKA61020.1 hypothetical protein SAMN02745111_00348 [Eubacterium uniforme]